MNALAGLKARLFDPAEQQGMGAYIQGVGIGIGLGIIIGVWRYAVLIEFIEFAAVTFLIGMFLEAHGRKQEDHE